MVDHDAAVGLSDFGCEEGPLRFESEVLDGWEERSSKRASW